MSLCREDRCPRLDLHEVHLAPGRRSRGLPPCSHCGGPVRTKSRTCVTCGIGAPGPSQAPSRPRFRGVEETPCPDCHGRGIERSSTHVQCRLCSGSGLVHVLHVLSERRGRRRRDRSGRARVLSALKSELRLAELAEVVGLSERQALRLLRDLYMAGIAEKRVDGDVPVPFGARSGGGAGRWRLRRTG